VLVRLQTEVAAARGERRLTGLVLRDRRTGSEETVPAAALFVMIGATPHADWLPDDVVRDQHGFILTGRDLAGEDEDRAGQPVPLPLETSMPGVFAVGDVRAGSVKTGRLRRRRRVSRDTADTPAPAAPSQQGSQLELRHLALSGSRRPLSARVYQSPLWVGGRVVSRAREVQDRQLARQPRCPSRAGRRIGPAGRWPHRMRR